MVRNYNLRHKLEQKFDYISDKTIDSFWREYWQDI